MSNVLFISDLHLFHHRVAEIRGFASIEDHNAAIIRNWTKAVQPDDQVWMLGDNQASSDRRALALIAELPGVKHLIAGNHDPVHAMHRDSYRHQRRYLDVFESVQMFARRRIDGHHVLLSHFPYETDHTEEVRYTQYRLRNEGRWLLHGHTHSPEVWTSSREIHVGVDAWGMTPVPMGAIAELIRAQLEKEQLDDGPIAQLVEAADSRPAQ